MPCAVVLTALPVEYLAVRSHLTDLREETHPKGTVYERGRFEGYEQVWDVGIVEIGAGNPGAALEAERAIAYFDPDVLLFVGVAGGIKDVKLGDVVASTKIYGYGSGKVEQTFSSRPELGLASYELEQRARAEARKLDWLQRITMLPQPAPRALVAPIAAGEKVIASIESEVFQFLQLHYGDAVAVEMEGFGFLEAVRANQRVSAIVIRGISDLIDGKGDADQAGSQEIASAHASAFAFEVLAKIFTEQPVELLPHPVNNSQNQRFLKVVNKTCPYQGLQFFDESTKDFFFGRKKFIEALRQKLEQVNFVPIIGNSGSGKSSVIRAGLIPSLRSEGNWQILFTITPSIDPLGQLKQALSSLFQDEPEDLLQLYEAVDNAPSGLETIATKLVETERILLVVDQFEEVFTLCPQGKEVQRDRFIQLLTQVVELHPAKLTVITVIRADFISACLKYESLTRLIQQRALYLPILNEEELREAIIHPAEMQGYQLEDELVEVILEDMRQEPECLPLLQFTLAELWKLATKQDCQLTLRQYRNLGRLVGALNQRADELYFKVGKRYGEQGQLWVKRILLNLVRTSIETKDTRQRQMKADLLAITGDKIDEQRVISQVLDRLVRERLLVVGGREHAWVDLAHEALIEGWHQFAQWRKEDRDLRRLSDRLRDVYQEWLNNQQEDQFLLMGGLLAQTQNRWTELEPFLPFQIRGFYKQSLDYKNIREQEGLQSSSFIGTFVAQIDGYIEEANDQFLQILGYSRKDFSGNSLNWTDITPREYLYIDEQRLTEANQRGECTPYEKEFIRKDGSRASVKISYAIRGGEKNTFLALVLDLTERRQLESVLRQKTDRIAVENQKIKEIETTLRESEELYRTLFTTMDDGFCVIEVLFDADQQPIDYRFLEINPAFDQQTGLRQAEGKTARQLFPTLEDYWVEIYGNVVLTGQPVRFENGSEDLNRWFDVYAFRVGQLQEHKVAILFKDISDRKAAEVERDHLLQREQAAREAAEHANRIKDEFLAVLSHELRTPLNPILGWSKLLRNSDLGKEKIQHGLEAIERNAKLQIQLIEDLLDISRIITGKLTINLEQVSLVETIIAAIETVHLAAEAKSIRINTILDQNVGLVLGDATRLKQVMLNLLSNAVKFTPQGGQVTVHLEQIEQYAKIRVSDTGKGIGSDFLPYIFELFRQENSATTRQFGGLGLGLSLVRQFVELHGGTITAASQGEGQGATFTVRLPVITTADSLLEQRLLEDSQLKTDRNEQDLAELEFGKQEYEDFKVLEESYKTSANESGVNEILETIDNEQNDSKHPYSERNIFADLTNVKVLVVDDILDSLEVSAFTLEQFGAQVMIASSVGEALDALQNYKPDILISDIWMPGEDGYSLIQKVRQLTPEQGGQIPAIALTAYTKESDQQRTLSMGFQIHLSKPVNPPTKLVLAVAKLAKGFDANAD